MAFREPNPPKSRSGWAILLGAWLMVTGYGLFSPALAHQTLTTYEGSKTCNQCHADKAVEVFGSGHYQSEAPPREFRTWPARWPENGGASMTSVAIPISTFFSN